ncbi:unnamed protein product [Bemisia tabaci]|uniref:Uncharacterized protein n=1 Tax=Bemisia tabaci TaxID=7038 RepID=A0A9P0CEM1_BEMTA|nr:PREDICTED: uncharacterized protein LOC109031957 [Bemisia tabaci]CAH0775175.1 unnamed protein product [Bemisia tabaci]
MGFQLPSAELPKIGCVVRFSFCSDSSVPPVSLTLGIRSKMPLRDLRKYWKGKQAVIVADSGGSPKDIEAQKAPDDPLIIDEKTSAENTLLNGTKCSLPIFQVWPSQDSPRGEADGQSFVFHSEDGYSSTGQNDSGIDSVQASPSPVPAAQISPGERSSPTPSSKYRRKSSTFLHPDHARLLRSTGLGTAASTPDASADEDSEFHGNQSGSASSSTASSLTSVAAAVAAIGARHSDPWERDRRRSSTVTARYSLLDALDLEYALIRAAARGSVGPYSLSESLHKLTFTQSLAFPALARGLASKRRPSQVRTTPLDPADSGLNAFAKIVTALVLMFVSVMVFAVVYKFVRT